MVRHLGGSAQLRAHLGRAVPERAFWFRGRFLRCSIHTAIRGANIGWKSEREAGNPTGWRVCLDPPYLRPRRR